MVRLALDKSLKIQPWDHTLIGRNKNGKLLVNFAQENNIVILNSKFRKRKSCKWTWISPDGETKNEIDFILTNNPNRIDININIINQLNFNSDHRMVRSAFKPRSQKSSRIKYRTTHRRLGTTGLESVQNNLQEFLWNYEKQKTQLTIQKKYNC